MCVTAGVFAACSDAAEPMPSTTRDATSETTVASVSTTTEQTSTSTPVRATTTTLPNTDRFGRWTHLPEQVGFGGPGDQVISGMTAGPAGFVAVGEDEAGVGSEILAAIWRSPNGTQWNRIPSGSQFRDSAIEDVVWHPGPELFVAVGTHISEGAVWVSADGEAWDRVSLLGFDGPGGGIEMNAIAIGGPGLIAVGMEWLSEGESIPAVWVSEDGHDWMRQGDLTRFGDRAGMTDVTRHGHDLYAVGYTAENRQALWRSTEIEDWALVPLDPQIDDEATFTAIASDQTNLAITGSPPDDSSTPGIWTSTDGQTWETQKSEVTLGAGSLEDISPTPSGWFAVGRDRPGSDPDVNAAVWSSSDGTSLESYPFGSLASSRNRQPAVMTAVASSDEIVVAGGVTGDTCVERYNQCSLNVSFWLWQP